MQTLIKYIIPLDVNAPTFAYSTTAIEVFPNPFVDRILVRLLGSEGNYTVAIYSLEGKRMYQQTFYAIDGEVNTYELSDIAIADLRRGMYVLTVNYHGTVVQAEKIIKQ